MVGCYVSPFMVVGHHFLLLLGGEGKLVVDIRQSKNDIALAFISFIRDQNERSKAKQQSRHAA